MAVSTTSGGFPWPVCAAYPISGRKPTPLGIIRLRFRCTATPTSQRKRSISSPTWETSTRCCAPFWPAARRKSRERHSIPVNYAAAYWTPPLTPRIAFDVESSQIEKKLGLMPLVSITDHDTIAAPMLLRTVAAARHIPVSVEWSAPFGGDQAFHFGIHNLPSDSGAAWMKTFEEYTAQSRRKTPDRNPGRSARSSQRADRLQPSHVGSLPDRRRQSRAKGPGLPHSQSRIHARLRAERPTPLGRKPQCQAPCANSGTSC